MKRVYIFAALMCLPMEAVASQDEAAACAYFLPALSADSINDGELNYVVPEFEIFKIELDRYAILTTGEFFVEKLGKRGDGSDILFGLASTIVACVVDKVDRRVLEISVAPGLSVGTRVQDARNAQGSVEVRPVNANTVIVGNQVHQGKY